MARDISISFSLTAALTGGFKGAFQSAASSARNVASAIRDMEKTPVGHIGAAMAQQREKIKGLAGSLKEAKATLATLQSQAQASGGATGMLARQIELAQSRVNNLNGAMQRQLGIWRNTAAQAATTGGSVRRLAQDYDHLSQRIERARNVQAAQAANRAQGDALRSQRADLNSKLTGAAAAAATVAIPAKLSIDFEQSIANVGAVSNASDEDMKRLTETARQLGRDTMFSASQAAEGMKYLAMAGFDTEKTIAAMPGMLDLAAAANTDLGTTADIASDILTAFGLKASDMGQVADTLAKTFTTSNTDLAMLGETMKYVAPVAASLGMNLQETSAYAGAMANAGIKASQGGTVLRAAMLRVAAPPKASRDTLAKLTGLEGDDLDQLQEELNAGADQLAKLGMSTKDSAGNMRPLVDIIEELNMRTQDMGTAEKTEVFKNVFGTEASAGMLALADQAMKTVDDKGNAIVDSAGRQTNALRKQMETVADYEGTVKTVAEKQMNTTKGSLLILSSAWQDVGISVGNLFLPAIRAAAGALSTIANVISGVVNRFPLLSKGIALVVGGVLAFTAASVGIGLVLNIVRTSLNGFRGGLLRIAAAHVAATASTAASTAATGGFGIASRIAGAGARFFAGGLRSILVATGVGALLVGLGFAINLLIDNWDAVVAAMSAAWGWVKDTWGRLGVFFSQLGKNLGAVFSGWGQTITGWVKPAWGLVTSVWNGLTSYYSWLFGGIAKIANVVWTTVVGLITAPVETVKNIWNGITGFFSGLWQGIVSGASSIGQGILSVFSGAKNAVQTIWNGITAYYRWLFGGIAAIAGTIWNGIVSLATRPVEVIKSVWNSITSFFSGLWNRTAANASGFGGTVINFLRSAYAGVLSVWSGVTGFFSGLWQGIVSGASSIGQGISSVFTGARDGVMAIWSGITGFFSGIANGITGIFAWSVEAIIGAWSGVSGYFSSLWTWIYDSAANLWNGVCSIAAWAFESVIGVWNGAVTFFSGIVNGVSAAFAWAHDSVVTIWQGVSEFFISIGQGISDCFSGVWQGIVDMAAGAWEGIAGIWTGVSEFFGGIVDSIFGVFTGLFTWLQEKFAWVFSTIDAVSGVIGSITGAVKGAWNAAFGDGDKKENDTKSTTASAANGEKATPALNGQKSSSASEKAASQQTPHPERKGSAAPNAQNAQANQGKKAMLGPDWKPGAPTPPEQKKDKASGRKKSSGGGRSSAGASGGGRSGSSSGPGAASGPVTVVTLDSGNEIKTQFFPAASSTAKPLGAQRPYGFGVPLAGNAAANATNASANPPAQGVAVTPPKLTVAQETPSQPDKGFMANAMSTLKSSGIGGVIGQSLQAGIGMAKSALGIDQNQQNSSAAQAAKTQQAPIIATAPERKPITGSVGAQATQPVLGKAGSALRTSGQPALPQAPSMIAKKQGQKSSEAQPGQQSISIDLTQNFDLITQDVAAARKVLEAIKPDMEALIRRALEKIKSDKRRTAYAQ